MPANSENRLDESHTVNTSRDPNTEPPLPFPLHHFKGGTAPKPPLPVGWSPEGRIPSSEPHAGDGSRKSLLKGPTDLRRLDTVEELSTLPDGTVIVWHDWWGIEYERQAGVLDTDPNGTREIRPVSTKTYQFSTSLFEVDPPVWVLTFDDPPATPE